LLIDVLQFTEQPASTLKNQNNTCQAPRIAEDSQA
jgi:hypothetical protein